MKRYAAIIVGVVAILLAGCVHAAENETLLPPAEDKPDLSEYIVAHYQDGVDKAFESVESRGYGTFSRIRLELAVGEDGRVLDAKVAIEENWNRCLLGYLKPQMEDWRLPATGEKQTCIVEIVRSRSSLRERKKDFRLPM